MAGTLTVNAPVTIFEKVSDKIYSGSQFEPVGLPIERLNQGSAFKRFKKETNLVPEVNR
jgi:hypothetical protein